MPEISIQSTVRDLNLHLWEMSESLEWFASRTILTPPENLELESMMGKRRKEFIVQRFLLQQHFGDALPILRKTRNGKPFLVNQSEKISITHSKSMLMLSTAPVDHGIDLEWLDGRIVRLADKFCNESEKQVPHYTDAAFWYTVIWSCKEALYKVDGLGQLDFRSQLAVHFTPSSFDQGWGRGMVRRQDKTLFFRLYFCEINGFVATWAYPI